MDFTIRPASAIEQPIRQRPELYSNRSFGGNSFDSLNRSRRHQRHLSDATTNSNSISSLRPALGSLEECPTSDRSEKNPTKTRRNSSCFSMRRHGYEPSLLGKGRTNTSDGELNAARLTWLQLEGDDRVFEEVRPQAQVTKTAAPIPSPAPAHLAETMAKTGLKLSSSKTASLTEFTSVCKATGKESERQNRHNSTMATKRMSLDAHQVMPVFANRDLDTGDLSAERRHPVLDVIGSNLSFSSYWLKD